MATPGAPGYRGAPVLETLHSDRGWHPALDAILVRLQAIGARRRDADYMALLAREGRARPERRGLVGELGPALELLRRIEADELQDLFNLEPPRGAPARSV